MIDGRQKSGEGGTMLNKIGVIYLQNVVTFRLGEEAGSPPNKLTAKPLTCSFYFVKRKDIWHGVQHSKTLH